MVTWRRRLKFRIHLGVAIGNHFNDKKNNENDVKVPNIYLVLNEESMIYESKEKHSNLHFFISNFSVQKMSNLFYEFSNL